MIKKLIEKKCELAKINISFERDIEEAFLLGMWWDRFPKEILIEDLEKPFAWDKEEWMTEEADFKVYIVAQTADDWKKIYRALRQKDWDRIAVNRTSGMLEYLFSIFDEDKPNGYQRLVLRMKISTQYCKQVQVGTETREVPIFETICDDAILDDFADEDAKAYGKEI